MSKTKYIILWLVLALVIRCSYILFWHDPSQFVFSDMANYLRMADAISMNEWNENLFFQPIGFPVLLVLIKSFFYGWSFPLALIQVLASTASLFLIWKVAEETWGKKTAFISLIIGTLHLPWIIYNGFALSETFFCFSLAVLLYLGHIIVKRSTQSFGASVMWGLVFLVAFFLKGSHVFMAPFFVLGILYYYRRSGLLKTVLPIVVIVSAGMIGHGLFTYQKIGKFQMSASAGGLNFVEGKCPSKKNIDSRGILWISPLYYQLMDTPEKKWDRPFTDSSYFMHEGLHCIMNNPLVMLQSFEGIPYLFFGNTLWPANQIKGASYVRLYELFFTLFMIPGLFLFLLIGRWSVDELLTWVLPCFSLFLCVYIFKSEVRFRLPFDVFFIPLSVRGWLLLRYKTNGVHPIGSSLD